MLLPSDFTITLVRGLEYSRESAIGKLCLDGIVHTLLEGERTVAGRVAVYTRRGIGDTDRII
jgi:hypothetical protein